MIDCEALKAYFTRRLAATKLFTLLDILSSIQDDKGCITFAQLQKALEEQRETLKLPREAVDESLKQVIEGTGEEEKIDVIKFIKCLKKQLIE